MCIRDRANLVPVGADQTQHLEICRDIAARLNALYSGVFTIPEGYSPKIGARVMSLQDPKRKMSKSDPEDCFIGILDTPDTVRRLSLIHICSARFSRCCFCACWPSLWERPVFSPR